MNVLYKEICLLLAEIFHTFSVEPTEVITAHGLQEKSINLTSPKFTFSLLEFMHNTLQKLITLSLNKLTFYSVAMIIIHFGIGVSFPCLD